MYLSIFDEGEQIGQESITVDTASLYCAFEQVKDRRKARGKRYPLTFLLTLLMLGKMAGEKTTSGVVDWVKEREKLLKRQFNWPKAFPVNSTYTDALALCDDQEIVDAIAQVIVKARAREACGTEPSRLHTSHKNEENLVHTAMDGKVLRGTLGHAPAEQPPVHLLTLYECESGIVIAQEAVKDKENEIKGAEAFIRPLLLKGRIVSADAMHTQKKWFAGVHGCGGYYLSIAKNNQPSVRVKGAPQALAALNGGVLALMDYIGVKNVAKQMRHFCAQPQEALPLLLGKLSR